MSWGDFYRRHRRKLFVTLGLSASAYMLVQYVKGKLVELQERILTERLARDNLERRFEQNQRDATFTILALLPSLGVHVLARYDVEAIKKELQTMRSASAANPARDTTTPAGAASLELQGSQTTASALESSMSSLAGSSLAPTESLGGSNPGLDGSFVKTQSKSQLWQDIKVQSLTRGFTLIYAISLLVLLTRLQLNVLGRRTYVQSVEELAGAKVPVEVSEQTDNLNRQYLTISWWLLNKGWEMLAQRVQSAVEMATAEIDPRAELTSAQLSELFGRIQYLIDYPETVTEVLPSGEPVAASFLGALLPPRELETYVLSQAPGSVVAPEVVDDDLRTMLDEVADLIESPNATEVMLRLVHAGISVLVAKLRPLFGPEGTEAVKLASVLATVTRQAHQMAAGHPMSNDYVDAIIEEPQLDALCAVIYTNF